MDSIICLTVDSTCASVVWIGSLYAEGKGRNKGTVNINYLFLTLTPEKLWQKKLQSNIRMLHLNSLYEVLLKFMVQNTYFMRQQWNITI